MSAGRTTPLAARFPPVLLRVATTACFLLPWVAIAQGSVGTLIVTVKDDQRGVLSGATVRVSSPSLVGGGSQLTTDDKGQLRFPTLPPGAYVLDITFKGMTPYHEENIRIGAGATIERTLEMKVGDFTESVVVEGAGSRIEARDPGVVNRFGIEDRETMPTRRASMFDLLRAAPGVSPTSPTSGTVTTVSAFGSGINENLFLFDGMNTTCPCNGMARAEPGIDFIHEVQIQSAGASAEFGNMQGAVFNVITRQGSDQYQYDASYYGQRAGLTSQPVRSGPQDTGYERKRYRDFTTGLGGPAVRDRLWFFGGYQYLRDYDSQPATDPAFPRTYEQDKIFAKLTWKPTRHLHVAQSIHQEFWVNSDPPTLTTPFEATRRRSASVPAITFGHLTHTLSNTTVWDMRVGRFVYTEDRDPSTGDWTRPSRLDRVTNVTTGAPPQLGGIKLTRSTVKGTISHFRPGLLGADHQWKLGGEVERGEQRGASVIPTGVRFEDKNGQPFLAITSAPSNTGGSFITAAAFASDAITVGGRLTISAGVRFDHSRAISQDLHVLDADGRETDGVIGGLGTLYTWNLWSPRLGVTAKLTTDGRTMLRASYGRFNQGVQTGEFSGFHPGVTPVSTFEFEASTGGYSRLVRRVDSRVNLLLESEIRAPHTDEFSVGVDREVGRGLAVAIAYVNKDGRDFIAWEDVGGQYRRETRTLANGDSLPAFDLLNSTADQRFLLTNPDGYSLKYNGLVTVVEKRWARGWQAFGSYTFSRASGLQASSGATAAGAQSSTVAAPNVPFGRDPNDLTNGRGRLPNDRPHLLRVMASALLPRTGVVVSANLQYFSGKPWAATALLDLPQNRQQRILLETRGSRRLSSQTLLDVRLSKSIEFKGLGRVELLLDVLNLLNDTAEEGIATDVLATETIAANPGFGQATAFIDPRRAMLGVRLKLGR